jgi:dTDP-4-amino-4,6-dideoxygalactose transaminase
MNIEAKWKIPLSNIDFGADEICAVNEVLQSGWISMGEKVSLFEKNFAEYLNVNFAFAVTNGTAALHLANATLDLKPGDEVILPSLTFVATANSILYTGATPVFADITSPDDLTISPEHIGQLINNRTRAIIVMHYGGNSCNMDPILDLAKRNHLVVIEDAAHAAGSTYRDQQTGAIGDIGTFSFFANKNLVTGEGGLITTNRPDLAEHIKLMRSHGMTSLTWDRYYGYANSYDVTRLGFNYRMDEIHAALGIIQLNKLEANNRRRNEIVSQYRISLSGVPEINIPFQKPFGKSAGHLFVIMLSDNIDRNHFIDGLKQAGIQSSLHYPPIHLFDYYRQRFGFHEGMLPQTEYASNHLVTLPLYPSMNDDQIDWVVKTVRELAGKNRIHL